MALLVLMKMKWHIEVLRKFSESVSNSSGMGPGWVRDGSGMGPGWVRDGTLKGPHGIDLG